MKPLILTIKTAPGPRTEEFLESQRFLPDANLSPVDKPPRVITDLKNEKIREKRIADWKLAQSLKIEQSILQKRQDAYDKAGLRWWTGKVVAAALVSLTRKTIPVAFAGDDEGELLTALFNAIAGYKDHYVMGKTKEFDVPFVVGRALALNIGVPNALFSRYSLADVHEIFGKNTASTQRGKLTEYAFGLGMTVPETFDSPTALIEQLRMGREESAEELRRQASQEAKLVGEIISRYHKVFKPAEAALTLAGEDTTPPPEAVEVPF